MSILSDFFIADDSSTPKYDCGSHFPAEDRCQFKSITTLEAAGILSVIRGGEDCIELLDEFQLLTPQDAEEWIHRVPVDMTSALATLDDSQMPDIAQRCADLTAEELGWSPDDFQDVLYQLRTLARRALDTGKTMYLWNSL